MTNATLEATQAPESQRVSTSQGQLTIGRMSWRMWKSLKKRTLSVLQRPEIQRAIETFLASAETASEGQTQQAAATAIAQGLPAAAELLVDTIDECTEELVADCCRGDLPKDLTAFDWLELRRGVLELNDPVALLDAEKNSLAGVARRWLTPATADSSPSPGGETPSNQNDMSPSKPD